MAIYSISDLEKLSGIRAHTIRAWEKRYEIIQPKRTDSNIRYYEDDDLKILLNVALLNKNGFKISKIAAMTETEKAACIAEVSAVNYDYNAHLDALTISMIELDEFKFDHILTANIQQIGFEKTMVEVIYPFLDKLSVLWFTGSINAAQERFISNLIRSKLIGAIEAIAPVMNKVTSSYLLYLPPGEEQELSLLFMHYLLKSRGIRVVYMGQGISLDVLRDTVSLITPDYVFTIISETFVKEPVGRYLDNLGGIFTDSTILVTGYQISMQAVVPKERLQPLASLASTIEFIERQLKLNE